MELCRPDSRFVDKAVISGRNPKITVLMCCFNAERWLEESIASMLEQTFQDFEFVIVNDGSCDNSAEIIRRFAQKDGRIVFIGKENTGPADSANVGIRLARGEWIARLDADDVAERSRLENQLALALAEPDTVFVGSDLHHIDDEGRILGRFCYPTGHGELLASLNRFGKFPPHSSAFYRACAVRSIGGYRAFLPQAEDLDLHLRMMGIGRFLSVGKPLVRIRLHSSQLTNESGGGAQRIAANMVMVSHWLRRYGLPDPLDNKAALPAFRAWMNRRLDEARIHDLAAFKAAIKSDMKGGLTVNQVANLFSHIKRQPALSARMLYQHIWGDFLPRRLAREWSRTYVAARPTDSRMP